MGEGAYEVWRRHDLSPWQGMFGVSATAPLWPLGGIVMLAIHEAWRNLLSVDPADPGLGAPACLAGAHRNGPWSHGVDACRPRWPGIVARGQHLVRGARR